MNTFSLIAFGIILVIGLLFLVVLALAIYAIWQLNKTTRRVDRVDALEQEIKKLREEVGSLRGNPPGS